MPKGLVPVLSGVLLLAFASSGCTPPNRVILQAKGSDTLLPLVRAWARDFEIDQPHVSIHISGGGTTRGLSALKRGTVDFANASRPVARNAKGQLIFPAEEKFPGVEHAVARDAVAVYVHPSNPIKSLSFEQLAGLYRQPATIRAWGDLDVEVPNCERGEILVLNHDDNSGTRKFFQGKVLPDDEFRTGLHEVSRAEEVTAIIAGDPCAIGFASLGLPHDGVSTPCVSETADGLCVVPNLLTASTGEYPLHRLLYFYIPKETFPEVEKFVEWVKQPEGQCIAQHNGYAPLEMPVGGKGCKP